MAKAKNGDIVRKTGVLSNDAKEYIRKYSALKSPEEIADYVGKSINTINKYIDKNNLIKFDQSQEDQQRVVLRKKLHNKIYWQELKLSFNKEELEWFENSWINMYIQFDEDVLETEDVSIKKYIQLELMANRCLKRKVQLDRRYDMTNTQYDLEIAKSEDEGRNEFVIESLQKRMESISKDLSVVEKEYREHVKSHAQVEESLKATRNQRIDKIADPTKNWTSVLKLLQDTKIQKQVSKHIEIMRASQIGEARKLMGYHTYLDGTIENPLLSYETLEYLEAENIPEPEVVAKQQEGEISESDKTDQESGVLLKDDE